MKRAIITVGLGFGDEGKGATVDFLTRHYEADLVVRYCGGSQAGHNVELPDGRRHTFSQFGAGTLAGGPRRARTFLGPNVVIDPSALRREAHHLAELGVERPLDLVTVHPRCLLTTFWHRTLNQLREEARGAARHGSCGQGIGEARRYWLEHGQDALFAADLRHPHILRHKLELQRQRTLLQLQDILHQVPTESLRELDLWDLDTGSLAAELEETAAEGLNISAEIPLCETAIFEGAQGVLLDEYRGFHPYTTWSTVTTHHAWELVQQAGAREVAVLGITRAYITRHGAGPLPTYCPTLTDRLRDAGNPPNRWQGQMRCGWLDLPLLRYAAAATGPLDGIVVNHLDELAGFPSLICESYAGPAPSLSDAPDLSAQEGLTNLLTQAVPSLRPARVDDILEQVSQIAPVVLTGLGPKARQRSFRKLYFRQHRLGLLGVPSQPSNMLAPVANNFASAIYPGSQR